MTHTVHPYAHRLGIIRDWKSRWFGARGKYQNFLRADILLREYLKKRLRGFFVDSLEIERGESIYRLVIKTGRPGLIIGRAGEGSSKLKKDVEKFLAKIKAEVPKTIKLDIEEVKNPEAHAAIAAYLIAEGLEKRLPFRRVMKQVLNKIMANKDVKGAKITLAGRLDGGEMSRYESLKAGQIPLQTLKADIDFAREEAYLSYGVIGIKVWIYRAEAKN